MSGAGHLSAQTLDLLLLGSLVEDQAQRAREHIEGCGACRSRFGELEQDRQRFEQFVFPRTLPKVLERAKAPSLGQRLRPWHLWMPAVGLTGAAVLVLLVYPAGEVESPYLGIKGAGGPGASALELVAQRGQTQFRVPEGARLQPGDRVRFVVDGGGARYLLIASKDAQGSVTVYYPFGGSHSAALQPARTELPGSIELDGVLGPERVYALFSDEPLAAEQVKEALAKAALGQMPELAGIARANVSTFIKEAP